MSIFLLYHIYVMFLSDWDWQYYCIYYLYLDCVLASFASWNLITLFETTWFMNTLSTYAQWDQPSMVMVVYDVTNDASFSACDKWLERVKSRKPSIPFAGTAAAPTCSFAACKISAPRRYLQFCFIRQGVHFIVVNTTNIYGEKGCGDYFNLDLFVSK